MKHALAWIKSNPLSVASAVVVLICFGFLGWIWIDSSGFKASLAERARMVSQIRGYMNRSVPIPPVEADLPPETITNVTLNAAAVDRLTTIYDQLSNEYRTLFGFAVQRNQAGHGPLVEGLFTTDASGNLPYEARNAYRRAFELMLQPYRPDAVLPRLDAGLPPLMDDILYEIQQLEQEYREIMTWVPTGANTGGRGGATAFSEEDQRKLQQMKQARLLQSLHSRASQIHLYATTDIQDPTFPFDVGVWSQPGPRPEMHQVWEGQLGLWIQQDIARAIALTNHVDNPDTNVMREPVKRLILIEVVPGYVGLHSGGGIDLLKNNQPQQQLRSRQSNRQPRSNYPAPVGGQTGSPDQRLPDNFYVGPTGRVSNGMYDVRHARLIAVVDVTRLPELIENISNVNFMTVLGCKFQDVDEYQALHEGFLYGDGDAVQVELLIETIWLREWTAPLMPPIVREYVGIDPPKLIVPSDQQSPWGAEWDMMMDPAMMMGPVPQ